MASSIHSIERPDPESTPAPKLLLRRLGSAEDAAKSYATALGLCANAAERRFLERRLREVRRGDPG